MGKISKLWKKFINFEKTFFLDTGKTQMFRIGWAHSLWYDTLSKLALKDGTKIRNYSLVNIGFMRYPKPDCPIVIRITFLFLSMSYVVNLVPKGIDSIGSSK